VALLEKYELVEEGFFDPLLRGKLADVGRGTLLEIQSAPTLVRWRTGGYAIDAEVGASWNAELTGFACPQQGLACPLFDTREAAVIKLLELKRCAVSDWMYEQRQPERVVPAVVAPTIDAVTRKRRSDGAEQVRVEGGPFVRTSRPAIEDLPTFWIDRTEVTVGDYSKCQAAGRCGAPAFSLSSAPGACVPANDASSKLPRNCVLYSQAKEYCRSVGGDLPTAAQWEKAAGGRTASRFPWGEADATCGFAVMRDRDISERPGCGRSAPAPVGEIGLGASPWGALDMAGSLYEWVLAEGEAVNAEGVSVAEIRGGSWGHEAGYLESGAPVQRMALSITSEGVGFRCVGGE
jgi:formylglycine-generating enzyme required for sulfatase activity